MPATSAAFGLRPVASSAGQLRQNEFTIASAYATNIFFNAPAALLADGTIGAATAGAANNVLGAFRGCKYKLTSTGEIVYSNYWPASTAATEIVAYVTDDPDQLYEIEADAALAITNIGNHAALEDTTQGSTSTGLSLAQLDTSIASTTTSQLVIVGFGKGADNAATDSFPVVRVKIGNHPYRASRAAGI